MRRVRLSIGTAVIGVFGAEHLSKHGATLVAAVQRMEQPGADFGRILADDFLPMIADCVSLPKGHTMRTLPVADALLLLHEWAQVQADPAHDPALRSLTQRPHPDQEN